MRTKISIIFFLFSFTTIFSQSNLNITLSADYISAERMLSFFETKSGNILELTSLKGNKITYYTTQMIENKFSKWNFY